MSVDLFDRPSTVDTGVRNGNDYYETPLFMVASLLHHQPIARSSHVLEPCVGDGAIARALVQAGFAHVTTNDLDPRHPATFHYDARALDFWHEPILVDVDWVITNPPFGVAYPILAQAWQLARVGVAMLLRKTFLEPTAERGPWFSGHPPTRIIGQPRHHFRGKGSDSCACDWVIWERTPDRALRPVVIDDAAKRRGLGG